MSLGDARIPENEAQKKAEVELRLNIGNLPHLGSAEYLNEEDEYIFPIRTCLAPETEGRESVQNRHVQILICKFQLPYTGLAQCSPMR